MNNTPTSAFKSFNLSLETYSRLFGMKHFMKLFLLIFLFSLGLFSQDNSSIEQLTSDYFDQGYDKMFIDKDRAYHYFEAADSLASKIKDYDWRLYILSYYIYTSDYHFDLEVSSDILDRTKTILELDSLKGKLEDYESYETSYLLNTGNYFYKLKEFEKAKDYFLKLHTQFRTSHLSEPSLESTTDLFRVNNFLGGIYKHTGKYELSEQYYRQNISLIDQNVHLENDNEDYLANVNQLLAQLYGQLHLFEKANALLIPSLDTYKRYYKKDKKFKNNLLNVYQRATLNFVKQDSLKKALLYLDESQEYLIEDDPFYKDALVLYGDVYSGLGEDNMALKSYAKALEAFLQYRQQKPHQDIAEVHGKIAEYYLKKENFQEGLPEIQKAFASAGRNIKIDKIENNPDPRKVFSKTQLLNLLDIKLQLLYGMYQTKEDTTYLDMALSTSNDILKTFDLLKKEFDSKLDKQFLAEKAYPVFHRMLEIAHMVYEINPSNKTLQLAVNISEKNKDFLLLEALRGAQATKYGNVSNTVLDRESQLRAKITNLEKKNFNAIEINDAFSEELFKLKQEYYSFLDTVKVKFPKYHDLKYQSSTLDLGIIRNKILQDNETLISFTMTPSHLYAITVNSSDEKFLKLPFLESDRKMVRDFYQLISSPSISQTNTIISELGTTLYTKILKKPLDQFDSENLILIADDVLHYLPFDLLQNEGGFLLKTHAISYGNSINTLIELKERQKSKKIEVLAFAPSFNDTPVANEEREFGQLLYNDDEVAKISTYFDTKTFLRKRASLENFKAQSPEAGIVHLATHASANDEFPDYSYLAFSEKEEDHILYIKDLYNTSLDTELVVLSACQTGIGKLQKGQGMMSLSKGFYYAGAKSLVTTLWKINDKSTVKLMEYFYENLSKGKSKPEALREAKLKYLETTDDELLRQPYYWAAFVVSGNADPINNPLSFWLWLLAIPIMVLIVYYMKRKISG